MSRRQFITTLIFIVLLLYLGISGFFKTYPNGKSLDGYILFIVMVIPAVSLICGLIFRAFFEREDIIKRFAVSSIACLVINVITVVLYAFLYKDFSILSDIIGFAIYCIVINFILLIINTIISLLGSN